MTPGISVSRCAACGAGFFPARLFCPRCGNDRFEIEAVHDGVVEQSTIVRHAAGRADWRPRHIASVRTADGQLIVAGLEEPLPDGHAVKLFSEKDTPVARKSA